MIKLKKILQEISNDQTYAEFINRKHDGLLEKVSKHKNYQFILQKDIEDGKCGIANRCETNAYEYIKQKLEEGEDYYFPVGGFMF